MKLSRWSWTPNSQPNLTLRIVVRIESLQRSAHYLILWGMLAAFVKCTGVSRWGTEKASSHPSRCLHPGGPNRGVWSEAKVAMVVEAMCCFGPLPLVPPPWITLPTIGDLQQPPCWQKRPETPTSCYEATGEGQAFAEGMRDTGCVCVLLPLTPQFGPSHLVCHSRHPPCEAIGERQAAAREGERQCTIEQRGRRGCEICHSDFPTWPSTLSHTTPDS